MQHSHFGCFLSGHLNRFSCLVQLTTRMPVCHSLKSLTTRTAITWTIVSVHLNTTLCSFYFLSLLFWIKDMVKTHHHHHHLLYKHNNHHDHYQHRRCQRHRHHNHLHDRPCRCKNPNQAAFTPSYLKSSSSSYCHSVFLIFYQHHLFRIQCYRHPYFSTLSSFSLCRSCQLHLFFVLINSIFCSSSSPSFLSHPYRHSLFAVLINNISFSFLSTTYLSHFYRHPFFLILINNISFSFLSTTSLSRSYQQHLFLVLINHISFSFLTTTFLSRS